MERAYRHNLRKKRGFGIQSVLVTDENNIWVGRCSSYIECKLEKKWSFPTVNTITILIHSFIRTRIKIQTSQIVVERERGGYIYEEGGPERRSRLEWFWNCWSGFVLLLPFQKNISSIIACFHTLVMFQLNKLLLLLIYHDVVLISWLDNRN